MVTIPAKRNASVAIWERVIQPARKALDVRAAKALLEFKLGKRDLDRTDALASKAASGTLTPDESRELEDYRTISTALEFMKSKARRSLTA
jgi:phage portal protein BeeE